MASHLSRRQAGTFAPPGDNGGANSWPWKWLLFLILIVFLFLLVVFIVWRVCKQRTRRRDRLSVLRNVNLVIAEDEKERDRALSRSNSVMSRVSRMTSVRGGSSLHHGSSLHQPSNARHSATHNEPFDSKVDVENNGDLRNENDRHDSRMLAHAYDIDEILISRGVLSASQRSKHSRYSQRSTSGRTPTTPARAQVARHGSKHQQAPFRPGSERIELHDEPQSLDAGPSGTATEVDAGGSSPRVRILPPAPSARIGGHATRGRGGSRDVQELSVIGESGASEATTASALGLSRSGTSASMGHSADVPSNESSASSASAAHASKYGHAARGASQSTAGTDVSPSAALVTDPFKSPVASSSGHGSQAPWSAISHQSSKPFESPIVSHGHITLVEPSEQVVKQDSTKLERGQSNRGSGLGRKLSAVIRLKQPKSPTTRDPRAPTVEIMQRQMTPSPEFEMINETPSSNANTGFSASSAVGGSKIASTSAGLRDAQEAGPGGAARTSLALSDESASAAGRRRSIGSPRPVNAAASLPLETGGAARSEVGSGPWTYTSKAQQWRDQKAATARTNAKKEAGLGRSSSMRTPEASRKEAPLLGPADSKSDASAMQLPLPKKSHTLDVGALPSSPLHRTPSIGVAGSKFKETFDDDDD